MKLGKIIIQCYEMLLVLESKLTCLFFALFEGIPNVQCYKDRDGFISRREVPALVQGLHSENKKVFLVVNSHDKN